MEILIFLCSVFFFASCTVSIQMTDTHGRGQHDVGEESTEATTEFDTSLPFKTI